MDEYREAALTEKSKMFHTFFFPVLFIILIWLIKFIEIVFDFPLYNFGVYPRHLKGVIGVFTSPLIHADFGHLVSNSIPIFVLGSGLFYYYRTVAYKIFFLILFATGFWVWVSARPSYHIGASGVVYGLASFMFTSGAIKKNMSLAAFSLVVVFLYGNMIWGVLPVMPHISWESHLMGAIAGIVMAFHYKALGPQKTTYQWETEEEEDIEVANDAFDVPIEIIDNTEVEEPLKNESGRDDSIVNPTYNYTFKPKKED
jgi:membrane associated rhomboid family serine protease